jgi:hypothetical protein
MFRGAEAETTIDDNFNYYSSQIQIRIEMAFGLMFKKWAILQKPFMIKLKDVWEFVVAVGQLHNNCINGR